MMHGDSYPSVPSPAVFADTIVENMSANPCASWLGSANHEVWNVNQEVQEQVDESFFLFFLFFLKPFITRDSTEYKTGHGTTSVHGARNIR